MAGGLSITRTILGRPGVYFGASHVAFSRCTDVVVLQRSASVLALLACLHLRARPFCRVLVVAYPRLGIRYGPTKTPLGTCVPTGVIRAHVGPPMVHRPLVFFLSAPLGGRVSLQEFCSVPWVLVPSVLPRSMAFGFSC